MKGIEKYLPYAALIVFFIFLKPIMAIAKTITGLVSNDDLETAETTYSDANSKIKNSAGVKSQMNAVNQSKAQQLYEAMNHMGTNVSTIKDILYKGIGPNQLGAIYLYYGVRQLRFFGIVVAEGDLFACLRYELSTSQYKELWDTCLYQFNNIK